MNRSGRRWRWLVWPIALMVIGLLIFYEQQVYSDQSNSLVPEFSPAPGKYDHDIRLEINTAHPEAETFFTLDGQFPDPKNGTQYAHPLSLEASPPQVVVIRAQSYLPDGTSGPVTSATYFMGMDNSLPILSIIVDPEDFWGSENGIYTNHDQRGRDWERPVDLTYVSGDNNDGFQIGAGIRVHGGWTRFFSDKKSLRLYFREEYGARKLLYPLFGVEGQIAFDHLVLHNSSKDLLLYRNQLVDRLTDQMGGFNTRSQPALIFINGRPWGIYNIRERITERMLVENYNVPGADISDTPNNRDMQSAEQLAIDTVHWENFMDFVLENDLTEPENYAFLQTQIDLSNFIDYYLLQMYVANSDWPHHNVHQFRPRSQGGRWEWIVWDNDLAFDRVERQMVDHVLEVDHPLGERMEVLLNKLLSNPEFRNLFLTRAADLLNTTLSTPNVQENVDALALELESDIDLEKSRWDISNDWEETKSHMREFAEMRPDIMRQHFVDSMELPGTAQITFDQTSEDGGWIVVNGSAPQQLPWQGEYFQNTTIRLQAIPPVGQMFDSWATVPELELDQSETITITVEGLMSITPKFIPLADAALRPDDVAFVNVWPNDKSEIEGDWFELQVNRDGGINFGGWRITDNDSLGADDEGSLIFLEDPLIADLPKGTIVRVIATQSVNNSLCFPEDGWQDGMLLLYAGNGRIDSTSDPWFNLGRSDNLVILAPGNTSERADDVPVGFWSNNLEVIPSSFGLPPNNLGGFQP